MSRPLDISEQGYENIINALKEKHNAIETDATFKENLVAVVINTHFFSGSYAAYVEDKKDLKAFLSLPKRIKWFIVPNVKKLALAF